LPTAKYAKEKAWFLKKELLNHTEPHIMACVAFYNELQKICNDKGISQEEAAPLFIQQTIESGAIPKSVMLQGKDQLEKITHSLSANSREVVDAWTANINERQTNAGARKDPIDGVFRRIFRFDIPKFMQLILIAALCAGIIFFAQQLKHF
jgi:hypothetical protein